MKTNKVEKTLNLFNSIFRILYQIEIIKRNKGNWTENIYVPAIEVMQTIKEMYTT